MCAHDRQRIPLNTHLSKDGRHARCPDLDDLRMLEGQSAEQCSPEVVVPGPGRRMAVIVVEITESFEPG